MVKLANLRHALLGAGALSTSCGGLEVLEDCKLKGDFEFLEVNRSDNGEYNVICALECQEKGRR